MKKPINEEISEAEHPAAKKPVILIVESDLGLLEMLADAFRMQNFLVHKTSSVKRASKMYKTISKSIDVVLLNGNAVGIEGIDIVIAIRRLNPDQKIIVISSKESTEVNAMKVQDLSVIIMRPLMPDKVVSEVLKLVKYGKKVSSNRSYDLDLH